MEKSKSLRLVGNLKLFLNTLWLWINYGWLMVWLMDGSWLNYGLWLMVYGLIMVELWHGLWIVV